MAATTPGLTLCMIVRNEGYFLERCLSAASPYVDEIVIVDTGSVDDTVDIARRFTDKLFTHAWQNHFADARNVSLRHAGSDWIVVLDADEVIEPEGWEAIRRMMATTDMDGFYLEQRNYSRERQSKNWLPVAEQTSYTREYRGYRPNPIVRLFRNRDDIHYRGRVHEVVDRTLDPTRRGTLNVVIHHHMDEDPSKRLIDRQKTYLHLIERESAEVTDGRLHTAAGTIRLHYLEDFSGAIEHLQKAVQQGYKIEENRESIAEARYRSGDLEGAYRDYLALYEGGHRSFNLCNNLANLAVRSGRRDFAAGLLQEALGMGVLEPETRSRLEGNIRYLRGNPEA